MARKSDPSARIRILEAVHRLMASCDVRRVRIEDIALEAGVGKGSVYLHFPTKVDLVCSYFERLGSEQLEQLHTISKKEISHLDRVRKVLVSRAIYPMDFDRFSRNSFTALSSSVRRLFDDKRRIELERQAVLVSEILEHGRSCGAFALQNGSLETARLLLTATDFASWSSPIEGEAARRETICRIERVVSLLTNGLTGPLKREKLRKERKRNSQESRNR